MKRHLETRRGYSENQLAPSRLIAKISLKCARLIAESNRASGNSRGRQACLIAVEHRHYVTDIHATVLHQLGLDPRKLEMPGSVTLNSTNKMNSSRVCVLASRTARRGSRETDRPGCFESLAGFVERQSCVWLAKKCQDDAKFGSAAVAVRFTARMLARKRCRMPVPALVQLLAGQLVRMLVWTRFGMSDIQPRHALGLLRIASYCETATRKIRQPEPFASPPASTPRRIHHRFPPRRGLPVSRPVTGP